MLYNKWVVPVKKAGCPGGRNPLFGGQAEERKLMIWEGNNGKAVAIEAFELSNDSILRIAIFHMMGWTISR